VISTKDVNKVKECIIGIKINIIQDVFKII
jgi:hypothetical protein